LGSGFYYRLVDGEEMTLDEVWLPPPGAGDRSLAAVLDRIATGAELRPGELLAPFAIDWVVLSGPEFRLDEVLVAQLDMVSTPLYEDLRVFEIPGARPLAEADSGEAWIRRGIGFAGEPGSGRVSLAVTYDPGWQPEPQPAQWSVEVAASDGLALYRGPSIRSILAGVTIALTALALLLIGLGRRRR
jgi:hypothetical protein